MRKQNQNDQINNNNNSKNPTKYHMQIMLVSYQ